MHNGTGYIDVCNIPKAVINTIPVKNLAKSGTLYQLFNFPETSAGNWRYVMAYLYYKDTRGKMQKVFAGPFAVSRGDPSHFDISTDPMTVE